MSKEDIRNEVDTFMFEGTAKQKQKQKKPSQNLSESNKLQKAKDI